MYVLLSSIRIEEVKEIIRKLLDKASRGLYFALEYYFRKVSPNKGLVELLIENPREFYLTLLKMFNLNEKAADHLLYTLIKVLRPDYNHIILNDIVEGIKEGDSELVYKLISSLIVEHKSNELKNSDYFF